MAFNFLTCEEFSGPSSCCFSCSHKLCCTGRGVHWFAAKFSEILRWVMLQRARRLCPIHPRTRAAKVGLFQGRQWLFLPHRQDSLGMTLGDGTWELWFPRAKIGHPRSRLWQRAQLRAAPLESKELPWWRGPEPRHQQQTSSNCTWCNLCLDLSVY